MHRFALFLFFPGFALAFTLAQGAPDRTILDATKFGLAANGVADDGPAIQRLLARVREIGAPVEIRFPANRLIRIETAGAGRYVFPLESLAGVRIDGGGSEFRLAPQLRFLKAERCSGLEVAHLTVDFLRQPTTPGTILKVDPAAQAIDVKLDAPEMAEQLGGPTGEDGEQAFFGMALLDAIYGTTSVCHFYAERVSVPAPGVVRVSNAKSNWKELQKHVRPGVTRIDLPVPGVAHRFGPGPLVAIDACRDVTVSGVEIWSAPWFVFGLIRNEGRVAFHRVKVRPKPGSGKVLASCRDAIHAKGNRAELLFEDCVLDGLGDDAFNLSTHCSRIREVLSPAEIEVSQQFPIGHIPFRAGDTLLMMSPGTNEKLAERTIAKVREIPSNRTPREPHLEPWAPASVLTLNEPAGEVLKPGLVVWSRESANPKSTIRRCVIRRSCRLQTPVIVEDCDVAALLWFYGEEVEGPGPESVVVRNSVVKSNGLNFGRGNAILVTGWTGSRREKAPLAAADTILQSVRLQDNQIWGRVRICKALEVEVVRNQVRQPDDPPISIEHCGNVRMEGNSFAPIRTE